MSLLSTELHTGNLRGTIYTFEHVGDKLPMHRHDATTTHIMIVARGSVSVHGPMIDSNIYHVGAVVDNGDEIEHEIVALEDNSRIVNIIKKPSF